MATPRPDAFSPSAPLAPDAPTSVVETQRIGGTHWQQRKLVEDERRLDAVAKRAANKQMAHAEANPQMFKRGTLDGDGNFVAYADDDPRQTENREAPAPHYIDPILHQIESRPANAEHDNVHMPERMSAAEFAAKMAREGPEKPIELCIGDEESMREIGDALMANGADLKRGTIEIRQNFGARGRIVIWRP